MLLSVIQLVYVVIVYVLCAYGISPVLVLSLNVINGLLLFVGRLYVLKQMMNFPIKLYFTRVFVPAIVPLLLLGLLGLLINHGLSGFDLKTLIIRLFFSCVIVLMVLYFMYMNYRERQFILKTIKSKIKK